MSHEDFNTACRLLHDMAIHADLQVDHPPTHPFKYDVFLILIENVCVY